jgi:DNA-binding transcriptional ArsR family regulator
MTPLFDHRLLAPLCTRFGGGRAAWTLTCKRRLAYGAPVRDVFRALADPTRRLILDELTERDGQTLFELCSRLAVRHGVGSSRQAISQHLDVLEEAGLVRVRRDGRYRFHHLDTGPIETAVRRWVTPPTAEELP